MKKERFYIKMRDGFIPVDGYVVDVCGIRYGIHHSVDKNGNAMKQWNGTHIDSGLAVCEFRNTRKDVDEFINENGERFKEYMDNESVKESVSELYAFLNGETGDETSETGEADESVDEAPKTADRPKISGETVSEAVEKIKRTATWSEIMAVALEFKDAMNDESVQQQFKKSYDIVKDTHVSPSGKEYESETLETADEMVDIVNSLATCDGVTSEIVGRFIWSSGDTKPYRQLFKAMGFTYMSNKKMWCKSYKGYKRKGRKKAYSYSQIKSMYGTTDEQAV